MKVYKSLFKNTEATYKLSDLSNLAYSMNKEINKFADIVHKKYLNNRELVSLLSTIQVTSHKILNMIDEDKKL